MLVIGAASLLAHGPWLPPANCVYIKHSPVPGRDGWVKKIQVMPGRNGSDLPFGGISATEVWSVKGWGDQGQENYDYGAIILPSPSLRKLPVP